MSAKTKFKDGQYYWAKMRPYPTGGKVEGSMTHPHWEPMLWDGASGKLCNRRMELKPEELEAIGEEIIRRPKRTARRLWMSTLWGRKKGKLEPIHDLLYRGKIEALQMGSGPPIQVEVSWENLDLKEAQDFARSVTAKKGGEA